MSHYSYGLPKDALNQTIMVVIEFLRHRCRACTCI